MLNKLIFFFLLLFNFQSFAQKDSLVSQTITYRTSKAGELYLVWGLDYWKNNPDKIFWPENSFFKGGNTYSKMKKDKDSFSITITLPAKSFINFMFWVPIDLKGDSTDGWDAYGNLTYTSVFDQNRKINLDDHALWMPDAKSKFSVLTSGALFLICAFAISVLLIIVFRKKLSYNGRNLFTGILIGTLASIIIIRMEMNDIIHHSQYKLFGAVWYDLFYFAGLALIFYLLLYLLRKYSRLRTVVKFLFIIILLASALLSILNIELVKQLGKPLNYQWLYYSDFMGGTDAKNALLYKLSTSLYTNIILLFLSIVVLGVSISFLPLRSNGRKIKLHYGFPAIFLLLSFYQLQSENYTPGKITNPVVELVSSTISAGSNPKLFSMDVSEDTKKFIENYHSSFTENKLNDSCNINNIVLFILESTPKRYINIYDSTYDVTPNIKKWKNISCSFTNMYSQIPSTSNSMATMISGLYPIIGYNSIINKDFGYKLPSLVTSLKNQNWETSFFASADLSFGNMESFARENGFEEINDSKTIECNYPVFHITNTLLDGLDDRCLTNRYLEWHDKYSDQNKFSVLWTNQTHYPYFINKENEKKFAPDHEEFNRFLNGLKSSDEAFGMLMDGLQKRNVLDHTIVIVAGDHGEAFGTHEQSGHASKIYEENVNVPFIIFNPLLCNGNSSDNISGLIDLAPTLVHILGMKFSNLSEGRSLFSDHKNGRTFFICPYSDFLFGTRTENWKYIYNATLNTNELYDLKKDPGELHNLSNQFPEIVKKENEMIAGWVQFHNLRLSQLEKK